MNTYDVRYTMLDEGTPIAHKTQRIQAAHASDAVREVAKLLEAGSHPFDCEINGVQLVVTDAMVLASARDLHRQLEQARIRLMQLAEDLNDIVVHMEAGEKVDVSSLRRLVDYAAEGMP